MERSKKEDCRRPLGLRLIAELAADVVYGLRKMRAAPAFTIVAVSILAIAIGANTAVFSVIDAVLLRMLPVERPHELRELAWIDRRDSSLKVAYSGGGRPISANEVLATSFAYPVYTHVRDHSTVFADLFLFDHRGINLGVAGREERIPGLLVSGNFLSGLRVKMTIGRPIVPDDDRVEAPAVAVLTHSLSQRLYGSAPGALGQTIVVNGTPAVIIGVTQRGFDGVFPGSPIEVMLPITSLLPAVDETRNALGNPRSWRFGITGRVKPGIDDERVRIETETLVRQAIPLEAVDGKPSNLPRVLVTPGGQGLDSLRRNYARPLYLLMTIMAVVLLIACGNIAGLLLTRATAREREMAVRLALGAGRARLIRQLLTESALLAGVGGGLGIGLAFVIRGGLLPLLNQEQRPLGITLGVSPWLVIYSIGLCLAVGLVCGMVPALRATRLGLGAVQARAVPGGGGTSRLFGGKTLIALQVALSLVLLVGAGLFVRTLLNLRAQPIGFRPDHILLFQMDPTVRGYKDARLRDFYERVLDRVAGLPDVRAAALSQYALLSGGRTTDRIVIPGAPEGQDVRVHLLFVSPRYLEAMGVPLLAGRDFTARDLQGAPRVALANQALARLLPNAGAPIGSRVLYRERDSEVEIVGLTADARLATLREPAPPTLYLPYLQYQPRRMTFAVRVGGDPLAVAAPIRQAIAESDPHLPLLEMRTQEAQIEAAVRQERVFAYVASGFALLALLLACLGIYGTLAHLVARRTQEIGLRMALGADRREVVSMVLRESLVPVIVGVVCGLGVVGLTTRLAQSLLFGLTPHDGTTLLLATLALMVSALLAAWLPSRRASGIDPMTALRCD